MKRKALIALTISSLFVLSSCSGFEYTLDETNESLPTTTENELDNQTPSNSGSSSDPSAESQIENEIPNTSVSDEDTSKDETVISNGETKIETIESDEVICIELYEPVCGLVQGNCSETDEDCSMISQTFSNSCFAEKAGAKEIKEGACE